MDIAGRMPSGKLILMAEDNPDNRLTMEAILEEGGYAFHSVPDGEQVLTAAARLKPGSYPDGYPVAGTERPGGDVANQGRSEPGPYPHSGLDRRAMKGDKKS